GRRLLQSPAAPFAPDTGAGCHRLPLAGLLKSQDKAGALAQLGIYVDRSPVRLQNIPGGRQTQPKSVRLGCKIGFEDAGNILVRNAPAIIIDKYLVMRPFLRDGYNDPAGLLRDSLDSIDDNIQKGDL